jgi:hypothetical protein
MAGKMKRRLPPPPPVEAEDEGPSLDPHELDMLVSRTIRFGDVFRFKAWTDGLDANSFDISGSVTRRNHHYVHEKTTSFEWELDFYGATRGGEELDDATRTDGENMMTQAEGDIADIIIDINKRIYKSLEAEYEYQTADEQVEEGIRANEYDFDEDGDRGGDLTYDQLEDQAKKKARDWFRQGCCEDSYWSESTLDDWKETLMEMGFGYDKDSVDISFSGFWSQGDGASFTCKNFDFAKFCVGLANPDLRQRIYDAS